MHVNPPDPTHLVQDYDFNFTTGQFLGVTIDPAFGDEVNARGEVIELHLGERPSIGKAGEKIPAERVTIFTKNLAFMTMRERTIAVKTPEEEAEWQETLAEIAKGIH